ncbi:MAG: EF-hand domain-containing protein [Sphingomonas sp.]|uniref:EF-hand domain-containing protein n=1 Tax=Sphingomonas sp. TaxID=28214 RepID=UPI0035A88A83|nr:EF-hand domain-containing protein [Sphingomonas sp.]
MKTMFRIAAVLAVTVALTPAANAQMYDMALSQLTSKFKASDKNGDGKLSLQEAKDGGMSRVVTNFKTIDTDKDGYVTFAQLKAQLDARYK